MMKIVSAFFLSIVSVCVSTAGDQQDSLATGILFEDELSWAEVQAKARAENKMIFVDCYTTWCAPCKAMDKYVYPLQSVGKFFNEHFICVKVQFDQTPKDNAYIKKWYNDAKEIEKTYSVDAFPTFLFLSPEGKPLHRAAGGLAEEKFLALANDALNPETQSYTLAAKYDPAKMDTAEMRSVAVALQRKAPELAGKIALAYAQTLNMTELSKSTTLNFLRVFNRDAGIQGFVNSYLTKLSPQQLSERKNIDLITAFLNTSSDPGFMLLYQNPDKADKVQNEGREYKVWFAKKYLDNVIYKEEVEPIIEETKKGSTAPDWNKISLAIQKKYNKEYADRLVLRGKMSWFIAQQDYEAYCRYLVEYMERFGRQLEFDFTYNNYAWEVFQFSNDPSKLEKALAWSNHAVSVNPSANWMDTYANILYKLNKKPQAMRWEEVALKLEPANQEFQSNLEKMKKGMPTWPEHQK